MKRFVSFESLPVGTTVVDESEPNAIVNAKSTFRISTNAAERC
jgi:hypothetical protein